MTTIQLAWLIINFSQQYNIPNNAVNILATSSISLIIMVHFVRRYVYYICNNVTDSYWIILCLLIAVNYSPFKIGYVFNHIQIYRDHECKHPMLELTVMIYANITE